MPRECLDAFDPRVFAREILCLSEFLFSNTKPLGNSWTG